MLLLPLSGEVKSSNENSITNIRTLYFTSDTHDSTSNTNLSTMKENNNSNRNSNDKNKQNKARTKVYPENRSSNNLTISISTTDDIKTARNSVIALLANKGNRKPSTTTTATSYNNHLFTNNIGNVYQRYVYCSATGRELNGTIIIIIIIIIMHKHNHHHKSHVITMN